MTIAGALAHGRERLASFGDDGRFDALRLLEESLGRNAAWLFAHGAEACDTAAIERYRSAIARRAAGEPVAYVVGSAGFYGRTFAVSRDVLVPRPESEMLVELARDALGETGNRARAICDVGTGSGILAITLACELRDARVTALDVSPSALAVARANADSLGVADRIRFVCSDLFAALDAGDAFDCIVANLPYIRRADLAPPPDSIAREPMLALDGGPDGLAIYRTFLASAPARLAVGGVALLEAGADTTLALAELAVEAFGPDACVHVHRDYAGHPRVVDVRMAPAG